MMIGAPRLKNARNRGAGLASTARLICWRCYVAERLPYLRARRNAIRGCPKSLHPYSDEAEIMRMDGS
jgi:hypothetical protein